MKYGIVSDVHVGNHTKRGGPIVGGLNLRCRQILSSLELAASYKGIDSLIIAGDLFDSSNPSPTLQAAVYDVLSKCGNPVLILVGNHEYITKNQSGLDMFRAVSQSYVNDCDMFVVDKVTVTEDLLLIPYLGPDSTGKGIVDIASKEEDKLVIFHAGIKGTATPPWLAASTKAVSAKDLKELKHHGILAGDWHKHYPFSPNIHQIGALVPTGWDNPGVDGYGSLFIWDTENPTKVIRKVIPGPRFVRQEQLNRDPDFIQYVEEAPIKPTPKVEAIFTSLLSETAAKAVEEAVENSCFSDKPKLVSECMGYLNEDK